MSCEGRGREGQGYERPKARGPRAREPRAPHALDQSHSPPIMLPFIAPYRPRPTMATVGATAIRNMHTCCGVNYESRGRCERGGASPGRERGRTADGRDEAQEEGEDAGVAEHDLHDPGDQDSALDRAHGRPKAHSWVGDGHQLRMEDDTKGGAEEGKASALDDGQAVTECGLEERVEARDEEDGGNDLSRVSRGSAHGGHDEDRDCQNGIRTCAPSEVGALLSTTRASNGKGRGLESARTERRRAKHGHEVLEAENGTGQRWRYIGDCVHHAL
jgi:hypothetical protein